MNEHRIGEIYQTLLEMNRDAFANGEYDIAYHLLLVALRCGQRLRDIGYLMEVEQLAQKESRYIDDHHPESEYSNKAAAAGGNIGIFQLAAQKARIIYRTTQATSNRAAAQTQSLRSDSIPGK